MTTETKVKHTRPIFGPATLNFREQYIISQALYYGWLHLLSLEERDERFPPEGDRGFRKLGEHAEPSNRVDMMALRERFHLYQPFDVIAKATQP